MELKVCPCGEVFAFPYDDDALADREAGAMALHVGSCVVLAAVGITRSV
jgi:hypothetical protein